jgi:phage terminase small subunit
MANTLQKVKTDSKKVPAKKLTAKEQAFVELYAADPNGSKAARNAGYSEKTAGNIANENLKKPHIQAAIKTLALPAQQDRLDSIAGRRAWLMDAINGKICEQTKNADGDIVDVAPKLSDRLKAIDLLGKTHGDYLEKVDLTTDGKAIAPAQIIIQQIATKAGLKADK